MYQGTLAFRSTVYLQSPIYGVNGELRGVQTGGVTTLYDTNVMDYGYSSAAPKIWSPVRSPTTPTNSGWVASGDDTISGQTDLPHPYSVGDRLVLQNMYDLGVTPDMWVVGGDGSNTTPPAGPYTFTSIPDSSHWVAKLDNNGTNIVTPGSGIRISPGSGGMYGVASITNHSQYTPILLNIPAFTVRRGDKLMISGEVYVADMPVGGVSAQPKYINLKIYNDMSIMPQIAYYGDTASTIPFTAEIDFYSDHTQSTNGVIYPDISTNLQITVCFTKSSNGGWQGMALTKFKCDLIRGVLP